MSFAPRHEGHGGMDMSSGGSSSSSSSSGSMEDMNGMDMGSGHSSMMMAMVFQTNNATPLYSSSWTPNSAGAYAGTCIFLVVLAIIARVLLALKNRQETYWLDRDARRRYVAVNGKETLSEQVSRDPDAKQMVLSENGVEETVFVVAKHGSMTRPWRFSVDPVRAVMDTVIFGVGYLL